MYLFFIHIIDKYENIFIMVKIYACIHLLRLVTNMMTYINNIYIRENIIYLFIYLSIYLPFYLSNYLFSLLLSCRGSQSVYVCCMYASMYVCVCLVCVCVNVLILVARHPDTLFQSVCNQTCVFASVIFTIKPVLQLSFISLQIYVIKCIVCIVCSICQSLRACEWQQQQHVVVVSWQRNLMFIFSN